jgi:hypothetical protein
LFIKVFENKDIEFIVSAFDPIINQYIKIESSSLNEGNYGVYSGQTIKISWEINMIGKLYENTIGNLPLVGSHELKILKETQLFFTFMTLQNRQIKKLIFHTFDSAQINKKITKFSKKLNLSKEETKYFVFSQEIKNQAYNSDKPIFILNKKGKLKDIAKASDQFNIQALTKPVIKHFICYPK